MYNHLIIFLMITSFSIVEGALPGAKNRKTLNGSLTKEQAASLAKIIGAQTLEAFDERATLTDDQKKEKEKFDASQDLFVNVARKGSLTVPSVKKPKSPPLLPVPAGSPPSPASMPSPQNPPVKK